MTSSPRFYALVPAAGTGSRAGTVGPKQYEPLAGQPLMAHTLAALAAVPQLTATLVVLAPGDMRFAELGLAREGVWVASVGGASRAETVAAGLAALRGRGAGDADWVLVHDAARCLLRPEWVGSLMAACQGDPVGGLLAQPLADTLKREADGRVQATVPRQHMWAAQTPQMFRLGLLERALAGVSEGMGAAVTDEASAVEALGLAPRLVAASAENFKVTYPADFALAETLLKGRIR